MVFYNYLLNKIYVTEASKISQTQINSTKKEILSAGNNSRVYLLIKKLQNPSKIKMEFYSLLNVKLEEKSAKYLNSLVNQKFYCYLIHYSKLKMLLI